MVRELAACYIYSILRPNISATNEFDGRALAAVAKEKDRKACMIEFSGTICNIKLKQADLSTFMV